MEVLARTTDLRTDRALRIPFFVPVLASGLGNCWTTNISSTGVGLTGTVLGNTIPQRGDDLELEFGLGQISVRTIARIAWTSQLRSGNRLGFGVQFREMSPRVRTELAMFLADHRPKLMVAFASSAERELVSSALHEMHVDHVDRLDQIDADMVHACSAIFVFAEDAAQLTGIFDRIRACQETIADPVELPLAPITLVTDLDSENLLPFDGNRIYEVLRRPLDRRVLVLAAQRSCERWALQVELRWTSLQLEGLAADTQQRRRPPTDPELPRQSHSVIRVSASMRRVYELIATVAVHNVPVLLTGETGTGKELAAREIHRMSSRAKTPFVAQDCGALIETLLESELFGHVRGAFTGATSDHPGLFQIADGGTIFLDEIQNTSPGLQAKLLRVVEEGEVRPVGGAKPKRVDVRLIAACNVDLKQAVKEQRFRPDFYYRLNRFPIELPPLRDHVEDIMPLAHYFVSAISETLKRPLHRIEPRCEAALLAYPWPGNIRELRNAIERAILLTPPGDPLRWETLPDDIRGTGSNAGSLDAQLEAFERRVIQHALERNGGVVRRAARDLDLNHVTLARRMKKLGLAGSD